MPFKSKNNIECIHEEIEETNEETNENEETELNETNETEDEIQQEIPIKKDTKKIKKYKTANGEEIIVKRKPKKKAKPLVVYMSESEDDEEQQVIVKPKPKRGRPKNISKKTVVEYVDKNGNKVDSRKKAKQTIINHNIKDKPLTASEIKLIELEEKLAELSAVSGKNILSTKKGKVDKRMVKPPTEKQLAARKLFVENNKIRALKKREEKENKKKQQQKENVSIVVDELTKIKKEKMKAIEDEKKEQIKETKASAPSIDNYFN